MDSWRKKLVEVVSDEALLSLRGGFALSAAFPSPGWRPRWARCRAASSRAMGEPRSTRSPVTGWISTSSCPAPDGSGGLLAELSGRGGSAEPGAWGGSAELAPARCTLYWKTAELGWGAGLCAGDTGDEGGVGAGGSSAGP